jgi:hypothetical protein
MCDSGNDCGVTDTISQVVNVPNNVSTLSFSGNTLICMGETTTLSMNGATSYTWNSGPGQTTGASVVVTPTTSAVFTVSSQNGNSCITKSIVPVSVLPFSAFTVSGSTDLCLGETTTLSANGVTNYTWTSLSGSLGTSSMLTVSPTQGVSNYTLFGFNPSLSCVGKLLVTVTVSPYPSLAVSGNTMACFGNAVTLNATGAASYTWSYTGGTFNGSVLTATLFSSQTFTVIATDPNTTAWQKAFCLCPSVAASDFLLMNQMKPTSTPIPSMIDWKLPSPQLSL